MAGPNLRQRLGHGFVSRQIFAEKAIEKEALVTKAKEAAPAKGPKGLAKAKGVAAKAAAVVPGGKEGAGFFDFMFKGLPAFSASDADLAALANAMKDPAPVDQPGADPNDNKKIPSGFTYLGQFVDHDITLDMTPLSRALADPEMVKNFRSPSLDLDCVYGAGPGPHRFLFARERDAGGAFVDSPKLLIGTAQASSENSDRVGQVPALHNDLPRNMQGVALIGDHRNDENLIVAQIHVAFLKFHNAVVDHLKAKGVPDDTLFEEAARTVRWHYQWMVLHDWVERLTGPGFVDKTLHDGRKFYRFQTKPFMPWEFSAAAYRLGHSMVRDRYSHNRIFRSPTPHLFDARLAILFDFTNLSGNRIISGVPGQGTLPSDWVIDWRRFFELPQPADKSQFEFNFSHRLDPLLAGALHNLPGATGPELSLAFRNLKRGVRVGLPSGQAVAKEMLKQITFTPLTENEIASGPDGAVAKSLGFHKNTPLWYYILKEAQVKGGGERLGPVGAQIVGEVFVGLVQGDETSFLSQPGWKPDLPAATPGTFLMTDLLTFVGTAADPANPGKALNPIGD